MIYSRKARQIDAYTLQLRDEDAGEVSPGWRELVAEAIRDHTAMAYEDERGRLLGIFGLTRGPGWASPWLLCDQMHPKHRVNLMRIAKGCVWRLQQAADLGIVVANKVPRHSTSNRRFLRALGFRIVREPGTPGPDTFYLPTNV